MSPARVDLPRPGRLDLAVLLALFVAHAVVLSVWLRADAVPNGFQNEFHHLDAAITAWVFLAEGRIGELLPALFADYYPPLLNLVGIVALSIYPGSEDWLATTNLLWVAVLLGSTWGLGEILAPRGGGIASALLVSAFPAIVGNARYFEPNLALAALCMATILAVTCAGDVPRRWIMAGLIAGGALLADRLTAAPCIVGAVAFTVGPMVVGPGASSVSRRQAIRQLTWFGAPAAAVIGPWLVLWSWRWLPELLAQVGGEITSRGIQTEHRSLLEIGTWLFYPLSFLDSQAGMVAGVLGIGGGAWFLVRERGPAARAVQGALVLSVIVLSLLLKKQAFYSQPIVPLGAVLAVWGLWRLRWSGLRWVLLGVAVVATLQVTVHGSTGWRPYRDAQVWEQTEQLIPRHMLEPWYPQLDQPDRLPLVVDDVAAWIQAEGWSSDSEPIPVYAESQVLYELALVTMLRLRLRTLRIEGAGGGSSTFHESLASARWFIYCPAEPDRSWPDQYTVKAMMVQRELVDELLEALQRDLVALHPRAQPEATWTQSERESIHLYELQ